MKMTIIGIFDRKAQCFVEMSATANVGVATRSFTEAVNKQSDSPVYKWPEDFELYELGTWDSETGLVQARHAESATYTKKLIVSGDAVAIRTPEGDRIGRN